MKIAFPTMEALPTLLRLKKIIAVTPASTSSGWEPMRDEREKANLKALCDCWSQWTDIIALFAQRRRARRFVNPRAYSALRAELVAACRSLAEIDTQKRSYYLGLEEIVRPWLSLGVLRRTDNELLVFVLQRCREIEKELSGRKWGRQLARSLSPTLPIVAGAAVILLLLWLIQMLGVPVVVKLRDAVDTFWLAIKYADTFEKLAAIAVIIVLVSIYTVSRTLRA
jgi:hypothetical protein